MSDIYSFVGKWTIRAVGGEVVWPFQLNNLVNIGEPDVDTLPVVVTNAESRVLGTYQGVYSDNGNGLKLVTIKGVTYDEATFTLDMTVLTTGPGADDRQILQGNWRPTGSPITEGTWVGNEGGVGQDYPRDEVPAGVAQATA